MRRLIHIIRHEALITSHLLYGNATLVLYILPVSMLSRCIASQHIPPATIAIKTLLHAAVFSITFGYVFELANQTPSASVAEDRANHPERPIPSGLLSPRAARVRWALSWVLFPAVVAHMYGAVPAAACLVAWQLWVLLFYAWPRWRHWASKSIFNGVSALLALRLHDAVLVRLVPRWALMISSGPGSSAGADLVVAAWVFCTIHIQDFSDVDGDRAVGRRTLPIVLGPAGRRAARLLTAAFYVVAAAAASVLGRTSRSHADPAFVTTATGSSHVLAALVLAVRTWRDNGRLMNKTTNCGYYYLAVFTLMIHLACIHQS